MTAEDAEPTMLTIIDVLNSDDPMQVPAEWIVRVPVRPPVWTTTDGQRIRIPSDAFIDVVRLPSGVVEIRGAYALAVEPIASNSIHVYLRDSMQSARSDADE